MRKLFLACSFILIGFFFYGLYLASYTINIYEKNVTEMEHHLFHDYKGVTHVVSSFSKGSSTPKSILLEAGKSNLDFLFFTDLNLIDKPYNINGYHGDVFTFSNQKLSYLDAHILIYSKNPHFYFNSLSAANAQLAQHFSEPKTEDRNYLTVLAHPFKYNHQWTGEYPKGLDGIEVINLRHLWQEVWLRDKKTFLWSILTYPFNPNISLLRLITDPKREIELWDFLNKQSPTLGFLGNETTARIFKILGLNFTFPSYSKSFSFASNHILIPSELTGHVETDRNKLFNSIKNGHFYFAFDTIGNSKGFASYIKNNAGTHLMGSKVNLKDNSVLHIDLPEKITVPYIVEVFKDGILFFKSNKIKTSVDISKPGVYRVRVKVQPKLPLPDDGKWFGWIYTNPFFVN